MALKQRFQGKLIGFTESYSHYYYILVLIEDEEKDGELLLKINNISLLKLGDTYSFVCTAEHELETLRVIEVRLVQSG